MCKLMKMALSIVVFLSVNLSLTLAQNRFTIDVNGRSLSADPIRRQLWEGQHLSVFSSPLFKRIEADLHKHMPIKHIRTQDSELRLDQISIADPSPGGNAYDYSIIDRFLANIDTLKVVDASNPSMNVFFTIGNMPRWLAEPCTNPNIEPWLRNPIWQRPNDYNKWATVVRDVVNYIKMKAGPRVTYYEIWNEPETLFWPCETNRMTAIVEYAKLYRLAHDAIKVGPLAPDPNGKVGGPAILVENEIANGPLLFPFYDRFLREIALTRTPLDFASWHRYFEVIINPLTIRPAPPSKITFDSDEIKRLLFLHGYNTNTELIKSEWNRSNFTEDKVVNNETEARFAALLPAHYYFMLQNELKWSFLFSATQAPENFITRWQETPEEKVRPNYNVMRIMNTLTGKRAIATSNDPLVQTTGEGVNVLASADDLPPPTPKTFNIVVWNYREYDISAAAVTITVNATYPMFLAGQPLRFRRYLVSPEKSNWQFPVPGSPDHLEMLEDIPNVDGGVPFSATYPSVLHNSVMLLTFCLENQQCAPLASPPFAIGPKIRNLFVEKTTSTTAMVSWDTPTTAPNPTFSNYVQYREIIMLPPPLHPWLPERPTPFQDMTTNHTFTIMGLGANKNYQVRSSTTLSGAGTISEEWLTFTTASANQTIYAFSPTDDTFLNFTPNCATEENYRYIILGLHETFQRVYLKFNVTGVVGTVNPNSVKLRLFDIVSGSYGGDIYLIPDASWTESTINCINPPMMTTFLFPLNSFVNPGVGYDFLNLPYQPNVNMQVSFGLQQPVPYALTGYSSRDNGTSEPLAPFGPRGFYPPPTLYVPATNP